MDYLVKVEAVNRSFPLDHSYVRALDHASLNVSAGEFLMGSLNSDTLARDDEKPQHKVFLDGYWIYRTEVTVAQYRKFCAAGGHKLPAQPVWSADNYPVVNVTWNDAAAYAEWVERYAEGETWQSRANTRLK